MAWRQNRLFRSCEGAYLFDLCWKAEDGRQGRRKEASNSQALQREGSNAWAVWDTLWVIFWPVGFLWAQPSSFFSSVIVCYCGWTVQHIGTRLHFLSTILMRYDNLVKSSNLLTTGVTDMRVYACLTWIVPKVDTFITILSYLDNTSTEDFFKKKTLQPIIPDHFHPPLIQSHCSSLILCQYIQTISRQPCLLNLNHSLIILFLILPSLSINNRIRPRKLLSIKLRHLLLILAAQRLTDPLRGFINHPSTVWIHIR